VPPSLGTGRDFAYQFSNRIAVLTVETDLQTLLSEHARAPHCSQLWVTMHFLIINQPTSKRCLCYIYFRTGFISVVKFHADCSRCQGFGHVHCWWGWFYFSLNLHRIVTLPCQTEISSLESLYEFYSLAHSVPSVSSECVSPATVALGFYSQRKLG